MGITVIDLALQQVSVDDRADRRVFKSRLLDYLRLRDSMDRGQVDNLQPVFKS